MGFPPSAVCVLFLAQLRNCLKILPEILPTCKKNTSAGFH